MNLPHMKRFAADLGREASREEELGQRLDHVPGREFASHADHQTLPGELVDDNQHPEVAAVDRPILDEIVRPDVIGSFGSPSDAGSVAQP